MYNYHVVQLWFYKNYSAFLCYSGEKESRVSPPLKVTVARKKRVIDQVFLTSVIILVSIIFINFGCALDWEFLRQSLKRPIGPGIGMFSQFIIMPLVSQAHVFINNFRF